MVKTSYTEARARFAELWDQVVAGREPAVITRRGHESVALIAADEMTGLMETVHLLRSRTNAERLLSALEQAKAGAGKPTDLATLRAELGLGGA